MEIEGKNHAYAAVPDQAWTDAGYEPPAHQGVYVPVEESRARKASEALSATATDVKEDER